MKAKYARLIRIGINARCVPYTSFGTPDEPQKYGTGIDSRRLLEFMRSRDIARSALTERAYWRTAPWVSRRLGARR
ncbi:hypothetical protein [Cryobacterium zhongshanensis]|uniref:Uncharacterized protein n=1 Tax=Cryobacterium zhongshanensis TaxID=2928153 RepID=A0AA41QY04_9MICO|nr:hypothetical protein [Cryobacterium zhongshanensis]MCI4659547.1 hypothetical protein [Cryobacterium zhongshanensis]